MKTIINNISSSNIRHSHRNNNSYSNSNNNFYSINIIKNKNKSKNVNKKELLQQMNLADYDKSDCI